MRYLLYIMLAFLYSLPAHAGTLETCYHSSNKGENVNACLEKYLSAAKTGMQDALAIAKQQTDATGIAATEKLTREQNAWETNSAANCRMHRAASSGAASEQFEKACLVEAYAKRGKELQVLFPVTPEK